MSREFWIGRLAEFFMAGGRTVHISSLNVSEYGDFRGSGQ